MDIQMSDTALIIIIVIWLLTIFRSILIMCGGGKLFKKALKGEKTALIPVINLFVMLEIVEVSTFLGILLFIPVINVIILTIMSKKLGDVFTVNTGFKIGLIFLPVVFYPLLFKSDAQYKYRDENYFLALDSVKSDNINLMTEDEVQQLNTYKDEFDNNSVDSIFKRDINPSEPVQTYKANRIDSETLNKMENLTFDDHTFMPIERIEVNNNTSNTQIESSIENTPTQQGSMFTSELDKKEDIEFIEL